MVTALQMAAQLAQRLGVQRGGYCLGQGLELTPHVAGEAGEDRVRRLLRNQAIEDATPVEAEDGAEDAAQRQAVTVPQLLDAVASPATVGDQLAPVPRHVVQATERRWRDAARRADAELAPARELLAVLQIGPFAILLLHLMGVDQRDPQLMDIQAGGARFDDVQDVSADGWLLCDSGYPP